MIGKIFVPNVHDMIIKWFIFFFFIYSNAVVGESSLDRLACALGGKTVMTYILTTVQTMLQNRKNLTLHYWLRPNLDWLFFP